MLGVSISCTIVLVIQIANLIASAVVANRDVVSVIVVLLIIEVAGTLLILALFNPASEFVKRACTNQLIPL